MKYRLKILKIELVTRLLVQNVQMKLDETSFQEWVYQTVKCEMCSKFTDYTKSWITKCNKSKKLRTELNSASDRKFQDESNGIG